MMQGQWPFYNPTRVEFGCGKFQQLGGYVGEERWVLITTPGFRRRGQVEQVELMLGERLVGVYDQVTPNPDMEDIDRAAGSLQSLRPDGLIALGGGSSMDTAKALARLLASGADASITQFFRQQQQFDWQPALPVVAVPTTAGTGAEVTPFATVWDFQKKQKHSLSGDDLFPRVAVVDPELTLGLPEDVTISSGLDAISHGFESIWNRNATPVSLALAEQSLSLSLEALPKLKKDSSNLEARTAQMEASTLAGMAISQTRTALAHSISYPLTAELGMPHGIACSFTLPALLKFNSAVSSPGLEQLAHRLGLKSVEDLNKRLIETYKVLEIDKVFSRNNRLNRQSILSFAKDMFATGRIENNIRDVSVIDVSNLLDESLLWL